MLLYLELGKDDEASLRACCVCVFSLLIDPDLDCIPWLAFKREICETAE